MRHLKDARVAELADAPDLGSGPARGGGSSPLARTRGFVEKNREKTLDRENRKREDGNTDVFGHKLLTIKAGRGLL